MGKVSNDIEYRRLSQEVCKYVKSGAMEMYSDCLKKMGGILGCEKRYHDKAKVLMLAFYVDLSGCGRKAFTSQSLVNEIREAVSGSGMDRYEMRELYLASIGPGVTPRHIMSVSDSLYILELELDGHWTEAQDVIAGIELHERVKCS